MRKPTETVILARSLPYFEGFMATRKTYKTQESYKYALGHFAKFMQEQPDALQDNAWREPFCKWLEDNQFSKSSIPVHLAAVHGYLKYSTAGWTLELTPNEYGERILPTTSAQHKRLNALSVSGKPRVGGDRVVWEFWGYEHLQLAKEVCLYAMIGNGE